MYRNKEFNIFMSDLVCILVLYKLTLEESDTFISLSKSIESTSSKCTIVVYDNSPEPHYNSSKIYPNWNILYVHNKENGGVSIAYNEGAKLAQTLNKKWLLLLDQDTYFELNLFEKYFENINSYQIGKVFVPILKSGFNNISPSYYFLKRGKAMGDIIPGPLKFKNKTFLNSGLLISLDTFLEAKGYIETIKLYYSDFSFSEKLSRINKYFYVVDSFAKHSLNSNDGSNIITFTIYCQGAYQFSKESNLSGGIFLFITVLLRSVKLSIKYRKFEYLSIFFSEFIGIKYRSIHKLIL